MLSALHGESSTCQTVFRMLKLASHSGTAPDVHQNVPHRSKVTVPGGLLSVSPTCGYKLPSTCNLSRMLISTARYASWYGVILDLVNRVAS